MVRCYFVLKCEAFKSLVRRPNIPELDQSLALGSVGFMSSPAGSTHTHSVCVQICSAVAVQ